MNMLILNSDEVQLAGSYYHQYFWIFVPYSESVKCQNSSTTKTKNRRADFLQAVVWSIKQMHGELDKYQTDQTDQGSNLP